MSGNVCYILVKNVDHKTYNGYTNNPTRRLRQHNGLIQGGAKYTTRERKVDKGIKRRWEYLVIVECPGIS